MADETEEDDPSETHGTADPACGGRAADCDLAVDFDWELIDPIADLL
jgi:hypothetical protein